MAEPSEKFKKLLAEKARLEEELKRHPSRAKKAAQIRAKIKTAQQAIDAAERQIPATPSTRAKFRQPKFLKGKL